MSPLVEQIIERLELLPERTLQKVLAIVDGLIEPRHGTAQHTIADASHVAAQNRAETDDMPNLENDGGIWLVKAGKQPLADCNDLNFSGTRRTYRQAYAMVDKVLFDTLILIPALLKDHFVRFRGFGPRT